MISIHVSPIALLLVAVENQNNDVSKLETTGKCIYVLPSVENCFTCLICYYNTFRVVI